MTAQPAADIVQIAREAVASLFKEMPEVQSGILAGTRDYLSSVEGAILGAKAAAEVLRAGAAQPSFVMIVRGDAEFSKIVYGHDNLAAEIKRAMWSDDSEPTDDIKEMMRVAADPSDEEWLEHGLPPSLLWRFEDGALEIVKITEALAAPVPAGEAKPSHIDAASIRVEDIDRLAERFWRVHPREIQDSGLTREQWYAREMRAALLPAPAPETQATSDKIGEAG